ncbi:MAG: TatD family hydrolase [Candidatus Paceibacterota bacterium]|jgi:TatD DNase family protein
MPKYFDIHTHVNFKAFDEDRDVIIRRALEADTWMINVGTQVDTSRYAIELAHKYPEGVYACIGLHPIHTEESFHDEEEVSGPGFKSRAEIFDKDIYREMLKDEKVVAIGECGLDYYHLNEESIEKQRKVFIEQIELAQEFNKPLMLHIRNPILQGESLQDLDKPRNAYRDVAEILKKYPGVKGVSHFFAGSVEDMKRFVSMGVYISFAGAITYKPKPEICDYLSVIKETPLEFILTDTDAPYVAPVPYRGKRNEPVYVCEIVKKIAEIKGLTEEETSKAIVDNAKRLFKL